MAFALEVFPLNLRKSMNQESRREAFVFFLLLAFGIVGRWAQPAWNFTPLAAVTAMGAYYFRGWLPAILLPARMLAMSNFLVAEEARMDALLTFSNELAAAVEHAARAVVGVNGRRRFGSTG